MNKDEQLNAGLTLLIHHISFLDPEHFHAGFNAFSSIETVECGSTCNIDLLLTEIMTDTNNMTTAYTALKALLKIVDTSTRAECNIIFYHPILKEILDNKTDRFTDNLRGFVFQELITRNQESLRVADNIVLDWLNYVDQFTNKKVFHNILNRLLLNEFFIGSGHAKAFSKGCNLKAFDEIVKKAQGDDSVYNSLIRHMDNPAFVNIINVSALIEPEIAIATLTIMNSSGADAATPILERLQYSSSLYTYLTPELITFSIKMIDTADKEAKAALLEKIQLTNICKTYLHVLNRCISNIKKCEKMIAGDSAAEKRLKMDINNIINSPRDLWPTAFEKLENEIADFIQFQNEALALEEQMNGIVKAYEQYPEQDNFFIEKIQTAHTPTEILAIISACIRCIKKEPLDSHQLIIMLALTRDSDTDLRRLAQVETEGEKSLIIAAMAAYTALNTTAPRRVNILVPSIEFSKRSSAVFKNFYTALGLSSSYGYKGGKTQVNHVTLQQVSHHFISELETQSNVDSLNDTVLIINELSTVMVDKMASTHTFLGPNEKEIEWVYPLIHNAMSDGQDNITEQLIMHPNYQNLSDKWKELIAQKIPVWLRNCRKVNQLQKNDKRLEDGTCKYYIENDAVKKRNIKTKKSYKNTNTNGYNQFVQLRLKGGISSSEQFSTALINYKSMLDLHAHLMVVSSQVDRDQDIRQINKLFNLHSLNPQYYLVNSQYYPLACASEAEKMKEDKMKLLLEKLTRKESKQSAITKLSIKFYRRLNEIAQEEKAEIETNWRLFLEELKAYGLMSDTLTQKYVTQACTLMGVSKITTTTHWALYQRLYKERKVMHPN